MNAQETQPVRGWFDSLQETFSFEKLQLSMHDVVSIVSYAGVGFLAGFLVKKYGKHVICLAIVFVACLWGLSHLGVIVVDWHKITALVGFNGQQSFEGLFTFYSTWAKEHLMSCISLCVGFLIGLYIG